MLGTPCTARAARFPITGTIRYRNAGERGWLEGRLLNVSRTGVLFEAPSSALPKIAAIEFILAFPSPGLIGMARVRCGGRVVRCREGPEARWAVATTIERYEFLRLGTEGDDVQE